MQSDQSPQEYFRLILLTVAGQAFTAAGYTLQDSPTAHAGGLFRFVKRFESGQYGGLYAIIEFQLLAYTETEFAPPQPSRFRVTLARNDAPSPALGKHSAAVKRDLAALVVSDFGVKILPAAGYWWSYRNLNELGMALGEAAHLIIGYGMPWLAGELQP